MAQAKEEPTLSEAQRQLVQEKHVLLVNRLHQILDPFVLRRQVKDVEGNLPPKVREGGRIKIWRSGGPGIGSAGAREQCGQR